MKERIAKIGQLFLDNEQAKEALKEAKTPEEAVEVFKQYGIEMTKEEFIEIGKGITSDELSEEMLVLVAGGSWKGFWRGVKDFFQGFLDAF